MEREVRYCASEDGTRIAYCVQGEGPPLVVCESGWESFGNESRLHQVYAPAWRGRTIVRYDPRGVGLSQRVAPSYALERMTADLEAVIRAANLDRFALWASTFTVGPAVLVAARHPGRVVRLVLMRVMLYGADVLTEENLKALVLLARSNWEMAAQMLGDLGQRHTPDAGSDFARLLKINTNPEVVAQWLTDFYATFDVRDRLADVACPTLIAHRTEDTLPFAAAQHAAAAIPRARLLALRGSGWVGVGDDAADAVRAMTSFLDEDPETHALPTSDEAPRPPGPVLRTVLFTDLTDHAEMMSRLGDERGRQVLREHERITREVLAAYGGAEIKTMGDGFMASFASVTRALECAVALQKAFAQREGEPLAVRCGLNAGEPIEEDGDLFGATVILASRIAAKAEGSEILVSDNVRSLSAGKGYLFAGRGEFVPKGFQESVRLYGVRWRG